MSAVNKSPVLVALDCNVTVSRGRFYVQRVLPSGTVPWGRITPLDGTDGFLLECPGRGTNWYEVARGQPIRTIRKRRSPATGEHTRFALANPKVLPKQKLGS